MSDIQMLEVSSGDPRPTLKPKGLTIEDVRTLEPLHGEVLRVFARESAGALTIGLMSTLTAALRCLVLPHSRLRDVVMQRAVSQEAADRHFLVWHTASSRVEEVVMRDPLESVVATLHGTPDAVRAGDLVVEISRDASGVLFDQLLNELLDRGAQVKDQPSGSPTPAPIVAAGPARPSPAEAARRRREAFLDRGWPTSRSVGMQLGSDAGAAAQRAADLRARGQLLGAWSSRERTYVHPDCQFDPVSHDLLPAMSELLAILPSEGDDGGWRRVFWLYAPRDALDGRAPADLLASDPRRVVALARQEFGSASVAQPDAGVG